MKGIYLIKNNLNNNCYVGQSVDIKRRFNEHKSRKPIGKYDELHKDIQSLGADNFSLEILEECDYEKLLERERYYIKKLNPKYNIVGKKKTEYQKKLISEKCKIWWENLEEDKKQKIIKNNLTGPKKPYICSEETKEKLRKINLGKKQSKETIEKRIAKLKGRKKDNSYRNKKIMCIETNEIFNSLKEAQDKYNLTTLCGHLKGKYKTCKGNHYKYM